MDPGPALAWLLLLSLLADCLKATQSRDFTVKDIIYLHPSTTPYPGGFKCFTCEKAADNYECNRWAPDIYCPRETRYCYTQHTMELTGNSISVTKRCVPLEECLSTGCRDSEHEGHKVCATKQVPGLLGSNPDEEKSRQARALREPKAQKEACFSSTEKAMSLDLLHTEELGNLLLQCPVSGEPAGCKTLLTKEVANKTSATFLRVVGSELIQKYLDDGPKLVRELFQVAEEHAPSIVFIDEINAIGTKRHDSNSGG
ncbi:Ly6/PLAUR domain-containing protein 6 [Tupaia chinensis]|uniref:Ly6/PLAUR domain-containing protein 6 n=1 Tax=Tupaia chinensis TaxID=246437 RepID=L9JFB6_TUPCH|nr:Ly6/PLAUR domain-containing protein 6 [Tupaia chinensis]